MASSFKETERFSGINNLTNENFFNGLTRQYPQAMAQFFNWMDNYGTKMKLDKLFCGSDNNMVAQITTLSKFYIMPFEMQIGIIIRFFKDIADDCIYPNMLNYLPVNELVDNFERYITRGFHRLECIIRNSYS